MNTPNMHVAFALLALLGIRVSQRFCTTPTGIGKTPTVTVCLSLHGFKREEAMSLTPTAEATQQSVEKRNKQERKNAVPRSPLKEFGVALGPGFCSECRIFTSQQTTFV